MEIPREKVVQALRDRGLSDLTDQADRHLPDPIGLDQHGASLKRHGLESRPLRGHIGV